MNALQENVEKTMGKSQKENTVIPKEYGCEILLEKTTLEAVNNPTLPYDAYLVWYTIDKVQYLDLTRCYKQSNLFDMYYDKYGPGVIQRIDFGFGKINPKIWGYQSTEKGNKKRK
jgi:hypothetical protein